MSEVKNTDDKTFYELVLDVYRVKMESNVEYINPNALAEILNIIEKYQQTEVDDEIWKWVDDMYGL